MRAAPLLAGLLDMVSLSPVPALLAGAGFLLVVGAYQARRGWLRRRDRRRWALAQKDVAALKRLSWQEFERLTGEAYRMRGYAVRETGGGGADNGADLLLTKQGRLILVSCKRYKARVGAPLVREAVGAAVDHRAKGVYVVALGGFTKAAKDYAKGKPVRLIDGPALLAMMNRAARLQKP